MAFYRSIKAGDSIDLGNGTKFKINQNDGTVEYTYNNGSKVTIENGRATLTEANSTTYDLTFNKATGSWELPYGTKVDLADSNSIPTSIDTQRKPSLIPLDLQKFALSGQDLEENRIMVYRAAIEEKIADGQLKLDDIDGALKLLSSSSNPDFVIDKLVSMQEAGMNIKGLFELQDFGVCIDDFLAGKLEFITKKSIITINIDETNIEIAQKLILSNDDPAHAMACLLLLDNDKYIDVNRFLTGKFETDFAKINVDKNYIESLQNLILSCSNPAEAMRNLVEFEGHIEYLLGGKYSYHGKSIDIDKNNIKAAQNLLLAGAYDENPIKKLFDLQNSDIDINEFLSGKFKFGDRQLDTKNINTIKMQELIFSCHDPAGSLYKIISMQEAGIDVNNLIELRNDDSINIDDFLGGTFESEYGKLDINESDVPAAQKLILSFDNPVSAINNLIKLQETIGFNISNFLGKNLDLFNELELDSNKIQAVQKFLLSTEKPDIMFMRLQRIISSEGEEAFNDLLSLKAKNGSLKVDDHAAAYQYLFRFKNPMANLEKLIELQSTNKEFDINSVFKLANNKSLCQFKLKPDEYDLINELFHGPKTENSIPDYVVDIGGKKLTFKFDNDIRMGDRSLQYIRKTGTILTKASLDTMEQAFRELEAFGVEIPKEVFITDLFQGCPDAVGVFCAVNPDAIFVERGQIFNLPGLRRTLKHETAHMADYYIGQGKYVSSDTDYIINPNFKTDTIRTNEFNRLIGDYALTNNQEFVAEVSTMITEEIIVYNSKTGKYEIQGSAYINPRFEEVEVRPDDSEKISEIMEIYNKLTHGKIAKPKEV